MGIVPVLSGDGRGRFVGHLHGTEQAKAHRWAGWSISSLTAVLSTTSSPTASKIQIGGPK
jgi:hypothetical protein